MKDEIKIEPYKTNKGKIRYKFNIYVGVNPQTGHTVQIKKQGYITKIDALNAYYDYCKKIVNGDYNFIENKSYKFVEVYELWSKIYKTTVKESTYATTVRYFNDHILNLLGSLYIDKIGVVNCQKAVYEWYEQAPRTFKRFMRYASNVFDFAIKNDFIEQNPMKKVMIPRIKEVAEKPKDFYSRDELINFLICARKESFEQYIFFRVLAFSGMRAGELLALTWNDVNFDKRLISVNKTATNGINNRRFISDSTKTISGVRVLDMDTETMKELRQWRLIQQKKMLKLGFNFLGKDNYVFPSNRNTLSYASRPTKWNINICKKYHLRHIKLHGFRHTHATLLSEANVPPIRAKERLGHKDIQTTLNIYTHVTKEAKKETADTFANYVQF